MPRMTLRSILAFLLLSAIVALGAFACGSDDGGSAQSGGGDTGGSGATTPKPATVPAQPTATPVVVEEGQADEISGVRVDDVTLEASGLGGRAYVTITNVLDVECTGPVIGVELLNDAGEVVGDMGIDDSSPLPAGEQKEYKQRYLGKTVSSARVSSIICDNSAPRHGAPRSPTKTQAAGGE